MLEWNSFQKGSAEATTFYAMLVQT